MRIKVYLYRTTKQCTLSSIIGAIQRKSDFKDIDNMLFYCRPLGIVPLVGDCIVKDKPIKQQITNNKQQKPTQQ